MQHATHYIKVLLKVFHLIRQEKWMKSVQVYHLMNVFLGMVISLKTNMAPENGPWKKEIPFQTSTADSGPHVLDGDPICPALLPQIFFWGSWGPVGGKLRRVFSDVTRMFG